MSDELDEIVDNLREPSVWLRVLFMLAFAILLYVIIVPVIFVLAIAQALFSILGGDSNANLERFGHALSKYMYQLIQFLTYNSDEKPFPFSDFPSSDDWEPRKKSAKGQANPAARKNPASKAKKANASKKTAPKKTPAKKAAAKTDSKSKAGASDSSAGTGAANEQK
jgi:hypothetical protein